MVRIRCETGDDVEVAGDSLCGADLAGRNLHRALLEGQVLRGANLTGAELRSAWLDRADFSDSDLSGARLPACSGVGARFVQRALTEQDSSMNCHGFTSGVTIALLQRLAVDDDPISG
jgi:uncharacterized protein YjbI with pentapeptide repeats